MCMKLEAPGVGSVFSGGDEADPERETAKKKRKPQQKTRELGECEEKKWGTKVGDALSFGGEEKKVSRKPRFVR